MKCTNVGLLTAAVVLFSLTAVAQHAGVGNNMASHGSASVGHGTGHSSGSTHETTINQELSKNTALAGKIQKLTGMPTSGG